MTITIVSYDPSWPSQFQIVAAPLRRALGDLALRIDHIGSTSVPGLAAKDRIDIQVTVAALTPEVEVAFERAGCRRNLRIDRDHVPPGGTNDDEQWHKWLFELPPLQRPTNLHVRVAGRANQRYALLFRDYLRAHAAAAEGYARVKRALARLHPDDIGAYLDVKDPVCDIIMAGAEEWAAQNAWRPGPSDA